MKHIIVKLLLVLAMSGLAMADFHIEATSQERDILDNDIAILSNVADDKLNKSDILMELEVNDSNTIYKKWDSSNYQYIYKIVGNNAVGIFKFLRISIDLTFNGKKIQVGDVLLVDGKIVGEPKDRIVYIGSPNGTSTVNSKVFIDTQTGLMWQDDIYATTVKRQLVLNETYNAGRYFDTSGMTGATYCSELTLGGYGDWRLPNIDEFKTIVDTSQDYNIKQEFKNKNGNSYWSSSKYKTSNIFVWAIFFGDGKTASRRKTDNKYIRCVRVNK